MVINLCGVSVHKYSFSEVVDVIITELSKPLAFTPKYVVTPNAQHIVLLQRDLRFRDVYKDAFLVVPDGVPLLWAAKLLGTPLKDRVNGTDLFEHLCAVSAHSGFKVFLLGGRPGSAEAVSQKFTSKYPGLNIVGSYCPPFGFQYDPDESEKVREAITSTKPDLLFVALGSPKQEIWIHENYQRIGVPISIGIGASFELASGVVQRAPKFLQDNGLEWLFRLLMEPKRLWKRYLYTNTAFIWLVIKQLASRRKYSNSYDS